MNFLMLEDPFSPRDQDRTLGSILSRAVHSDGEPSAPEAPASQPGIPWHDDALRLHAFGMNNAEIARAIGKSIAAVWRVVNSVDRANPRLTDSCFYERRKPRAIKQTINRAAIAEILANREGNISLADLRARMAA